MDSFTAPHAALLSPTQALTGAFVLDAGLPAAPSSAAALATKASQVQVRQGFRLGDLRLMVRYEDGSELTELPHVYRLPNAPAWFCGIANLHGMLVPVFDLARYIGFETDAGAKRMLLVLAHGADAAGIVIDGLPERLRWAADQGADPAAAPARLAPHVHAAALIGEQLWFDLDCAALLDALEQAIA